MRARAAVLAVALAVPIRALGMPDVTIEVYGIEIARDQGVSSGDLALTRNLGPDDLEDGQPRNAPPSTWITWPVTKRASSLARKRKTGAMSVSGSPRRAIGRPAIA